MSEQEAKQQPQPSGDDVQACIARYQSAKRLGSITRMVSILAILVVVLIYVVIYAAVGFQKYKAVKELTAEQSRKIMLAQARRKLENDLLPTLKRRAEREREEFLPKLKEQVAAQVEEVWPDVRVIVEAELTHLQKFAETTLASRLEEALTDFAKHELAKVYPQTDTEKLEIVLDNLQQAAMTAASEVFWARLHEPLEELRRIEETLNQFPPPYPYLEDRELAKKFGKVFWEVVCLKAAKIAAVE